MNRPGRWRYGVLASAMALIGSMASLEAHALALGRISVQSALGEPLRAEIDIAEITPEEAASFKAGVASVDAFKAAGLEFTQLLTGLEVNLQRRADGRAFLRLTSNRPVTEPFVDLILQANWASGRITRDYTMLFDPPSARPASAAATPTAPILSRPAAPAAAPQPREPVARPVSPAPATRAEPVAKASPPKATPAAKPGSGDRQVTVKAGDSAGRIAAQHKPESVSLDQMLVALLRGNPDAFIGGNINRVKSGAVLDLPGVDTAGATSPTEASQTILAQSKDFNAFRRKLAEGVSTTQVANADRQAGGKVQAKVEDRAPASATPDKLTLSKGAVQGKSAGSPEDKIAKSRQASDESTRVAELSRNISDLNKLGAAPVAPAVNPAASAPKAPGAALPAPSGLGLPATVPALAASTPKPGTGAAPAPSSTASTVAAALPAVAPAATQAAGPASSVAASSAPAPAPMSASSEPSPSASAPVAPAVAAVTKPAVPVLPPPEASLIDDLLGNPLVLPLAGGLLALLAGLGIYSYRRRNASATVDSSFLESRLQPDSFFGASGGQRVDTNEASAQGSSLVYSPSQLDAAGDVDPVAEADVYLAYGRDLQAEEILKEAMRTSPTRVAIHSKLTEIYAKRRDSKAFEMVAAEAFNLTHGKGPEWAYITEMGRELEPENPLYQSGSESSDDANAIVAAPESRPNQAEPTPAAPASRAGFTSAAISSAASAPANNLDFDLDLLPGDTPLNGHGQPPPVPIAVRPPVASPPAPVLDSIDLDFTSFPSAPPVDAYTTPVAGFAKTFSMDTGRGSNGAKPVAPAKMATPAFDSGMLEFDLDSLSLDLNGPTTQALPDAPESSSEDPLQTKFLLAEEFRSLGDADGARSLAEEVLAEAQGPLKVKAQAFLNALA